VYAFSEVATAAYCPRKLYYHRRSEDSQEPPPEVREVRELAFRYDDLADADDDALAGEPLSTSPLSFRRNLGCARARFDVFDGLADPDARDVLIAGRECRGVVHKLVEGDPPIPSLLSAGEPPERGVWEPQSVRAVAAAKALASEREREIPRAFYEYPAHGVVREVPLTTNRKAAYRRAVRAVDSLDGPPPRLHDDAKCGACEYRADCGTRSRSLKSLLGL
jgi:CRISPR-associated exonuclease Cas4